MSTNPIFIDVAAPSPSVSQPIVKQEISEVTRSDSARDSVTEDDTQTFMCPECGYKCNSPDRVAEHIEKKHRAFIADKKRTSCNFCNYSTYSKNLLQEHINRHKGLKPYKCAVCPYRGVSKKYVKLHEAKHVRCKCGFTSLSNTSHAYKRHLRVCGALNPRDECRLCHVQFTDEALFKKHKLSQKQCSICKAELCSSVHKKHMQTVHDKYKYTKTLKDLFRCTLCDWSSFMAQKILLHLIHHPQDAPGFEVPTVLKKCGINM